MKNTLLKLGSRLAVLPVLLLPASAYAQLQPLPSELNPGGGTSDLPTLIGGLINAVLGVVGIVFVVLVVYAGVLYMTAQGEAGKVEKAKTMLTQAVIGIVIIVLAYAISNFVISTLIQAT
jgi:hypothetical protein